MLIDYKVKLNIQKCYYVFDNILTSNYLERYNHTHFINKLFILFYRFNQNLTKFLIKSIHIFWFKHSIRSIYR